MNKTPIGQDLFNDKFTREFLRNYIGKSLYMYGTFDHYGARGSMLLKSCTYYDPLIDSTICIGHMWLQNILNKHKYSNLSEGDTVYVIGTVTDYKNNDRNFSLKTSMGLNNCSIQSAYTNMFRGLMEPPNK